MEFSGDPGLPTEFQLQNFQRKFRERPFILQLKSADNENNSIFIKEYNEMNFMNMLQSENVGLENFSLLREMLKIHGRFGSDVEAWQLSEISDKTKWLRIIAKSVLIIRVIKLFEGKCDQIVPWLTADCVLQTNCLEAYLSFIDKPLGMKLEVQQAWENKNFQFLEIVISKDSPFPKSFDL